MVKVGIYGASGYTGQELLRLLLRHPQAEPSALTSRRYAGRSVGDIYLPFRDATDLAFVDADPKTVASMCDIVFLAVPHGEAMEVAEQFLKNGVKVIDLSADYRLRDVEVYEKWYRNHTSASLLDKAVYGLPEVYRKAIKNADLVANPGCYPTGAILGLVPLVKNHAIELSSIIVDSKSGTSGAGRDAKIESLFCEVNEGFKAYKIFSHRHSPEIDQEISVAADEAVHVTFTPHLVPANRGILTTIYGKLQKNVGRSDVDAIYNDAYKDETFIRLYPDGLYPNISAVRGSNFCDIGCAVDEETGRVIVITAIDNLMKGAASQAVQNMNLMCGFDEACGLKVLPLFP